MTLLTAPGSRADSTTDSRALGWVVIGTIGYYVAAIALLHWLRPDVNPAGRILSEYAIGPYGLLMTSTFLALSLAFLSLGMGLRRSIPVAAQSTAGIGLLFLAAFVTAVAGIFPTDVGVWKPVTPAGWVHRIAGAGVAFPSMTIAALLVSWRLRRDAGWRDLAWVGTLVGSVGLLLFAAIPLFLFERGLAGASQRILLILIFLWMLVLAQRMIGRTGTARQPASG